MSFYERLSAHYDDVFPYSADVFGMLEKCFPQGANVLDIACGTGTYSIPLAKAGRRVTAFDLDPEMTAKAQAKAEASLKGGVRIPSFIAFSMETIAEVPGKPFDGAFCIGNSLVHLPTAASAAAFLHGLRGVMAPGGTVLIQIINYDRIIDKRLTGLPSITAPGVTFERNYRLVESGKSVIFNTRLIIERPDGPGPEILEQEIPLLPLRRSELTDMMDAAGFRNLEFFGTFSGGAFDLDASMPLIIRGKTS